ncbi:MAG: adenosylmethionine decarboxylase [Planctomycetes bacterium]|nr:adenosylmethionine decarboxylase [Planctomycetota bacterium]
MDTLGRHLLSEYRGCARDLLDDPARLEDLLRRAAAAAGANVLGAQLHRFRPQGVSGVLVIEESHVSIHTWPEAGYAAADFYTCGDCDPVRAHEVLAAGLGATSAEVLVVTRGLPTGPMRVTRPTPSA